MRVTVRWHLRLLQEALGLKNRDMAARIGISESAYSNWVSPKAVRLLKIENAIKICDSTRATLDFIYRGLIDTLPETDGLRSKIAQLRFSMPREAPDGRKQRRQAAPGDNIKPLKPPVKVRSW